MAGAVEEAGPSPLAAAGSPSGASVAAWAVQFPFLPKALSSLPPGKELTVLGATHRRPAPLGGQDVPVEGAPTPSDPPAQGPRLSKRQAGTGSCPRFRSQLARACLGKRDSQRSLILTLRAPDQKERASGFRFLGLSFQFCDYPSSYSSGALSQGPD